MAHPCPVGSNQAHQSVHVGCEFPEGRGCIWAPHSRCWSQAETGCQWEKPTQTIEEKGVDQGGIIGRYRKCLAPIYGVMCLDLGGPLSLLSGSLLGLFSSASSLSSPATLPAFVSGHPNPPTLHDLLVKVMRERVDWLPAGQWEGGQGVGRSLVHMVQTSHGPPGIFQLSP